MTTSSILPLIHLGPIPDLRTVAVQTTRLALEGEADVCGELLTLNELRRRDSLKHRPLTAADVRSDLWSENLLQYAVREDSALVTSGSPVSWGTLNGDGTISWGIRAAAGADCGDVGSENALEYAVREDSDSHEMGCPGSWPPLDRDVLIIGEIRDAAQLPTPRKVG